MLSVSSSFRFRGLAPVRSTVVSTFFTKSGLSNCRALMFTATMRWAVVFSSRPCRNLFAGRFQHPVSQGQDQPGLLRQRNEFVGRKKAALGMLPPYKRLGPDQRAAIHLRLIVELEVVRLDRLAKVFFHLRAVVDGGLQGRGKEMQSIASRRLRLIHRNIRLLQDFIGAVLRIPEHRDSDAGTAAAFAAIEQVRADEASREFSRRQTSPELPQSSGSSLSSCSRTTNSSPPKRATVSVSRMLARIRRATSCSRRSPT